MNSTPRTHIRRRVVHRPAVGLLVLSCLQLACNGFFSLPGAPRQVEIPTDNLVATLPTLSGPTPREQLMEANGILRQQLIQELDLADVLTPERLAAADALMLQAVLAAFPEMAEPPSDSTGALIGFLAAPMSAPSLPDAPPLGGLHIAPSWASSALSGMWYDAAKFQSFLHESDSGTRTMEDKDRGITTKVEARYEHRGRQLFADVTMTITYQVDGVDYVEVTHVTVTSDLCPDSEGTFNVSYKIDYSLSGGRTASRKVTGTAIGHVGDDAFLKRVDFQTETVKDGNSPVTMTYGRTATPNQRRSGQDHDSVSYGDYEDMQATGTEGKSDLEMYDAAGMSLMIAQSLVQDVIDHAQAAWREGGCVNITIPEGKSHKVEANESFPFTAKVEHIWEGGDVPVPVDGNLLGSGALVPGRIDPAPDTFVVTAGTGTYATVELETVSRRGIDHDAVSFDIATRTFTVDFNGTFDYDFSGLTIHGDVVVPPIKMSSQSDGSFQGEGPVQLALSANLAGCQAKGMQDGGSIVLTAKKTSDFGDDMFRFVVEESDAGNASLNCPNGFGYGGAGIAAGAGLINLGEIRVPIAEGEYPFHNQGVAGGANFAVQGVANLAVP